MNFQRHASSFCEDSRNLDSFRVHQVEGKGNRVSKEITFTDKHLVITNEKTGQEECTVRFNKIIQVKCRFRNESYEAILHSQTDRVGAVLPNQPPSVDSRTYRFLNMILRQQFCLLLLAKCKRCTFDDGGEVYEPSEDRYLHGNVTLGSPGRPCELYIYRSTGVLAVQESRAKKMYPLTQNVQLEVPTTGCTAALLLPGEPKPLEFTFSSVRGRESFVNHVRLWKYLPDIKCLRAMGWKGIGHNYNALNIRTATFNVGETKPPQDLHAMSNLLPRGSGIDMYAISLQECKAFKEWFKAIESYLSGSVQYTAIAAPGMWGIRLFIFVKETLLPHITNIKCDIQACGKFDMMGNKGAVGCGFRLYGGNSLAFVSSHLAARAERVSGREKDFKRICAKLCLGNSSEHKDVPFIHSFDHVFWLGDLNYRVDLGSGGTSREFNKVVALAKQNRFVDLVAFDQLNAMMHSSHGAFSTFEEGRINFPPSYRLIRGNDTLEFSNKRCQNPSYTDRIIWKSRPNLETMVHLMEYDCDHTHLLMSDHRAVFADFHFQARLPHIRALENGPNDEKSQHFPRWSQIEFQYLKYTPSNALQNVSKVLKHVGDGERRKAMFFGTFPGGSGPTRCSEASVETNIPPAKDDAKLTALGISNTLELSSLEMDWLNKHGGLHYLHKNELVPSVDRDTIVKQGAGGKNVKQRERRTSLALPSQVFDDASGVAALQVSGRRRGLSSPVLLTPAEPLTSDRLASPSWLHSKSFGRLKRASSISSVNLTERLVSGAEESSGAKAGKRKLRIGSPSPSTLHLRFSSGILDESGYSAPSVFFGGTGSPGNSPLQGWWNWNESSLPVLHSSIRDPSYLHSQHLIVAIGPVNKSGKFVPDIGFTEIPIACTQDVGCDEYTDIDQIVVHDGIFVGKLTGKMRIQHIDGVKDVGKMSGVDATLQDMLEALASVTARRISGSESSDERQSLPGFATMASITDVSTLETVTGSTLEVVSHELDLIVEESVDSDGLDVDNKNDTSMTAGEDNGATGHLGMAVANDKERDIADGTGVMDVFDRPSLRSSPTIEEALQPSVEKSDEPPLLTLFDKLPTPEKMKILEKMIAAVSSEGTAATCVSIIEHALDSDTKDAGGRDDAEDGTVVAATGDRGYPSSAANDIVRSNLPVTAIGTEIPPHERRSYIENRRGVLSAQHKKFPPPPPESAKRTRPR